MKNLNIEPDKRLFELLYNLKKLPKDRRVMEIPCNWIDNLKKNNRRCISCSIVINKEKDKVFRFLKNVEQFPKFMEWVKTIIIHEREHSRAVSEWLIDFEGTYIAWREEEIFDESGNKIRFNMLDGDFDGYCGEWDISEVEGKKTLLTLRARFNWGIPNFEILMGHILRRKAEYALRTMLRAIKKAVEKTYE